MNNDQASDVQISNGPFGCSIYNSGATNTYNITLNRVQIDKIAQEGFLIQGVSNVSIINSTATNSGWNNLYSTSSSNVTVLNCTFTGSGLNLNTNSSYWYIANDTFQNCISSSAIIIGDPSCSYNRITKCAFINCPGNPIKDLGTGTITDSTPTGTTFGSTSIGGSVVGTGSGPAKTAGRFQLTAAGNVTKISAYVAGYGSGGFARAAIYSDLNGLPNMPLGGATVQVSLSASAGWVDFVYAAPVHLTAGYYWLSLIDSAGCNWYYGAGGVSVWKWISYSGEPTAPFGASTNRTDLISIYATYTADPVSSSSTFGSTSIGGSVIGTGTGAAKTAGRFQLTAAGNVTKISAFISGYGSGGFAEAAIYSDLNGQPNVLIGGATAQVSVSASAGWVDFVYAAPVHLAAGTYWLTLVDSSGCNWYYSVGGVSVWSWVSYGSEPVSSFGSHTDRTDLISIYATYTPG